MSHLVFKAQSTRKTLCCIIIARQMAFACYLHANVKRPSKPSWYQSNAIQKNWAERKQWSHTAPWQGKTRSLHSGWHSYLHTYYQEYTSAVRSRKALVNDKQGKLTEVCNFCKAVFTFIHECLQCVSSGKSDEMSPIDEQKPKWTEPSTGQNTPENNMIYCKNHVCHQSNTIFHYV